MKRNDLKRQYDEDILLTAWAADVFLKSTGPTAYKTDKFILGARYANNNPSSYIIIRISRLINYYEDLVISNKNFINSGYVDFVQKHWNDHFDMDCVVKEMNIKLLPEEIKKDERKNQQKNND